MSRLSFRLVAAQTADALTFAAFMILCPVSIHAERNPLLMVTMAFGGFMAIVVLKIAVAGIVTWRYEHRPSKPIVHAWYEPVRIVLISAATASGIVGAGFNLASLVSTLGSVTL